MRIGFIGLGSMGGGMSRSLLRAGHELHVTDARREAADPLVAVGATWWGSPAEVARASDVVVTMLPTPAIVAEVALGAGGILEGLADDGTWIDMSTSTPPVQQQARERSAGTARTIIDAPVSGMSSGAAAGRLQIFVGGTAAEFQAVRPVLAAMGDEERILHVGPAGAGYAVKLMINQLWFSHLVATSEVLAVGTAAGVDLGVLRTALLASPAASAFVERDVLSVLERGDYDEGFAMALACKDLGLSIDLARSVGVPVELSATVDQVYARAKAAYGPRAGEMAPMRLYEDALGHALRLAPIAEAAA